MTICADWATEADLCSPCDDYSLDSALLADYLTMASETLYVLSQSQFPGTCTTTIRPCRSFTYSAFPSPSPMVNFSGGRAYNVGGCSCSSSDACSCPSISEIVLPHDDVIAISQVKVDGTTLSSTLYRLDPPNRLVSLGDNWPCCQDMSLPTTADNTFSVSYSYGLAPPELGVKAAAVLACELYMLCQPEDTQTACRLPSNWTSIARQGITVSRLIEEIFRPGPQHPLRFGIPEIDLFLATYAPHGHVSYMVSPDDPPVARITG